MIQIGDYPNVDVSYGTELTTVTFEMAPTNEVQSQKSELFEFLQQPQFVPQRGMINYSYNKFAAKEGPHLHQELLNSEEMTLKDAGINSEEMKLKDAATNSDASTIDNVDIHVEEYQFLTALDSENLMKFSQQSAMQDLLNKENIDIDMKPNLDVLPTLDEHDIAGYKFNLVIQPQHSGVYSDALNKVYIRMNDTLNFDVIYTPKIPFIQLRVRVLLCFVKETSKPVLRCQNHISKDNDTDPQKLRSVLRCENPRTEYRGTDDGRSINDRYSILVPLSMGVTPLADRSVRQSIALKFTCQNSCLHPKETSLIFLLESMSGEIFSQRNVNVKVCSCPKRDRNIDEKKVKRKNSDDEYPRTSKLMKEETNSIIKEEPAGDDLDELSNSRFEFECKPNGCFRMVLETRSQQLMQSTLRDLMREAACMLYTKNNSRKRKQKPEFFNRLEFANEEVKKF